MMDKISDGVYSSGTYTVWMSSGEESSDAVAYSSHYSASVAVEKSAEVADEAYEVRHSSTVYSDAV